MGGRLDSTTGRFLRACYGADSLIACLTKRCMHHPRALPMPRRAPKGLKVGDIKVTRLALAVGGLAHQTSPICNLPQGLSSYAQAKTMHKEANRHGRDQQEELF